MPDLLQYCRHALAQASPPTGRRAVPDECFPVINVMSGSIATGGDFADVLLCRLISILRRHDA
jgi:hypothetical protein